MLAPRAIAERLVGQVRHLAKHLLMCAPMLVVAGVLVASGAGVIAILVMFQIALFIFSDYLLLRSRRRGDPGPAAGAPDARAGS
jgi:hypothetical protein